MINIKITDASELDNTAGYLHDAVFTKDGIAYDAAEKTFSMRLWRELYDETRSERIFWFLYRWKAPHRNCILEFRGVDAYDLKVTGNFNQYQVRDLQFDRQRGELRITTAYCLKIVLRVIQLQGILKDLELTTDETFFKTTIAFSAFRK